jgi:ADP-dependent NAD(P)H-hydrate dehydratase / NAD(P)H-hydrate epimerase
MKVVTPDQMREIDRRTMQLGIPGLILMENAGSRVVDVLKERFDPIASQRIVVVCGKGNNGGDGLVVARQLFTRFRPRSLEVVLAFPPEELSAEARQNFEMLLACGCPYTREVTAGMSSATLVVDALLGTGLKGPAEGRALDLIRMMNSAFPMAARVSVDVPSGLHPKGESVAAALTVTFTAPKVDQVMPPTCDLVGDLIVSPIGTPPEIIDGDPSINLYLTEVPAFRSLFLARPRGAHKGDFGHVLIVGGARGKGGAAAMAGLAALRAGAGLVTVASAEDERSVVTGLAPELMTQSIEAEHVSKSVLAVGPGLGHEQGWAAFARRLFADAPQPVVVDADGLNALAGTDFRGTGILRVLTPHPGEMSRLTGMPAAEVQANRLAAARSFALHRQVVLVLKGQRTLVAFPDGEVWVNPTGTPAMATAGSGDILTGMLAGLLAQFPDSPKQAILAAVWLHGRSGELGANTTTEQTLIATDLLRYLPDVLREIQDL